MKAFDPKRVWFWIAVAAAAVAVIALLLPHNGSSAAQQTWLALLPVFFVGVVAAFSVQSILAVLSIGHAFQAPALAPSFQRPPPAHLA